ESEVEHVHGQRFDQARLLGERDELARGQEPLLRMLPAHQRLDALRLTGAKVGLRLVDEMKLLLRDRLAQLGRQRQPANVLRLAARVVDLEAAAVLLRDVHRDVGAPDQALDVAAVVGEERDADARSDRHRELVQKHRILERVADQLDRPLDIDLTIDPNHDAELVPTEPGNDILVADRVRQSRRELAEKRVAARMTERVVYLLEAVEVDEQDRDLRSTTRRLLELLRQPLAEEVPVGKRRQAVVE